MKLSSFIIEQMDPILDEWEKFARAVPIAHDLDTAGLRDHARGILEAVARDLESAQTAQEQADKSRGQGPSGSMGSEAVEHGHARVLEGFTVNEAMAEFRALRASVLRLWREQTDAEHDVDDVVRFNEAIDQALSESLERYSEVKDRQSRLFEALLSTSPDLNYIVDLQGRLLYANKALADVFCKSRAALLKLNFFTLFQAVAPDVEQHVRDVVSAGSAYCGEMTVPLPSGLSATYDYVLVPVFEPGGRCEAVAGTARDITERKAAEEKVRRSANYDHLTGLANRSLFRERLDLELRHAARSGLPLALMYIDLDGFKGVNDRLGHDAGDQMLKQTAARIEASVRDTDTVARLGGDEFTVILTDVTVPPFLENIARKILDALDRPFQLPSAEVGISGSIGIALYPQDGAQLEELIRHADSAMYAAKHAGRNRYCFYARPASVPPQ